MKFKNFVKIGTILTAIILVFTTIVTLSAFALQPTQPLFFTNALLLVLILVQLLIVSALISIHDELAKKKGGRRR